MFNIADLPSVRAQLERDIEARTSLEDPFTTSELGGNAPEAVELLGTDSEPGHAPEMVLQSGRYYAIKQRK